MIIYLHICRHVYLYITYTLPCQPVAYHDLFVEHPQIAPGLTMLKRLGVERHRTETSVTQPFRGEKLEPGAHFFRFQLGRKQQLQLLICKGNAQLSEQNLDAAQAACEAFPVFPTIIARIVLSNKGEYYRMGISGNSKPPTWTTHWYRKHPVFNDPQVLQDFVRQAELHRCLRLL